MVTVGASNVKDWGSVPERPNRLTKTFLSSYELVAMKVQLVGGEHRMLDDVTHEIVAQLLKPTPAVRDVSTAPKFRPCTVSDEPPVVGAFGGLLSTVANGAS